MTLEKDTSAQVLSPGQLIRLRFARHRLAMLSVFVLAGLYLMALLAEAVALYPVEDKDLEKLYSPPQKIRFSPGDGFYTYGLERKRNPATLESEYLIDRSRKVPLGFFVPSERTLLLGFLPIEWRFFGPENPADRFHPLGADQYGRDIFSRIVFGARISLSIGLCAILISFILGITIGGISGYFGGKTDLFIQRLIEIVGAFPQLPLWLALATVIPDEWSPVKTYFGITVLLSLIGWEGLARVVRGKIISLREEDYAVAAKLLGAGHSRILFRHLMPGFTRHIVVALTLSIPTMILGETALSFLGLGLRPPVVSWGVMLQDSMNIQVVSDYPWMLMPVFFIILTVLTFNFIGDGIRDAADPYST